MANNEKVIIPIFCENDRCQNSGRLVNAVSEIPVEDLDLFYESYGGSAEAADYCPVCGELGVAEDPVLETDFADALAGWQQG